jgi:hypothetical protein
VSDPIDNQRLPIPVGAKYAQRARIRAFRLHTLNFNRYVFNRYFLLAAIGLVAAIGGALLNTQPPTFKVALSPANCTPPACTDFQIQNLTLKHSQDAQGNDVYMSEYGAMVVASSPGAIRTGGSTRLNGQDMTGTCLYELNAPAAHCTLSIGQHTPTSVDTKTATGWDRHYNDGHDVKIDWPHALFPVPFAFGE